MIQPLDFKSADEGGAEYVIYFFKQVTELINNHESQCQYCAN